ncbi:hypothetical protein [Brevibacterium sp. CFH 10365]|uniref:hypothetical protein n=1 Tax=Brevibacterium sp. CFH 10365 TaxID=2585207 RepID=UPI001D0D05C1|nr:hypothetical protein [Brevibacterium sp. CFH 10365]
MDSADEAEAVVLSSDPPTAESEAGAGGVFRVRVFVAAEAFSVCSAVDEAVEEPALFFDAPDFAVDDFDDVVVLDAAVLDVVGLMVVVLDAVVFGREESDADVWAAEDLEAADFEDVEFDSAALDCFALEVPAFDVADFDGVVFAAVFEPAVFASAAFSDAVVVDFVVPAAFGFRRRDDCIDAAGSVRAVREVFASPSLLPSSVLPPEKKTSTGRSLEFASGINAPSPRPRPLFFRSTTTYSSIRNFFSCFPIRQGAA